MRRSIFVIRQTKYQEFRFHDFNMSIKPKEFQYFSIVPSMSQSLRVFGGPQRVSESVRESQRSLRESQGVSKRLRESQRSLRESQRASASFREPQRVSESPRESPRVSESLRRASGSLRIILWNVKLLFGSSAGVILKNTFSCPPSLLGSFAGVI